MYSHPGVTGYQLSQVFKPGQDVPLVIDGSEVARIPVADILPWRGQVLLLGDWLIACAAKGLKD